MPQKSLRVKSRFEASENISATARKIEKNTRRLNKSMKRGFKESSRSALKFKGVLKSILAAGAITKGFSMLSQGVQEVTTQFIGFDDAIVAAAVRFKDIGPEAKNFEEQLQTIKKSARVAGQTTIFTAEQAAVALDFLARAGFTSVEAMGSLNSMINLSIASGEDFAAVSDQSSDLLGSFFGIITDGTKKISLLNRLNDVLVKTVNSANVKVEDLFDTMKQVGPVTKILGSGLEEVSAMAAILGSSGLKGSDAMTALKNIFLRLSSPASAGKKTLEALGLTIDDGTGKAKGMTAFMEEMGETLKGFGQIEQAKILDAVFGKRAIAGAKVIFDNIQAVKDFRIELDNAGGIAQKTADIMQTSLGNRIKGLGSSLTELGFKVLDPFEKKIKSNIEAMTEFFRGANPQPLVDALTQVATAMNAVGNAIDTVLNKDIHKAGQKGEASERFEEFLKGVLTGKKKILSEDSTIGAIIGKSATPEEQAKNQQSINNFFRKLFLPGPGAQKGISKHFRNPFSGAQPELATPMQPNLNVNVQNNIKGNDVEVETEVETPQTSGGQGRNNF